MLASIHFVYSGPLGWEIRRREGRPTDSPVPLTGIKPEKKPSVTEPVWQGVLKPPWTTEWFLAWKWYSMTSPTTAVTESGTKVRVPLAPTSTRWVVAETAPANREATVMVLNCIFKNQASKQESDCRLSLLIR